MSQPQAPDPARSQVEDEQKQTCMSGETSKSDGHVDPVDNQNGEEFGSDESERCLKEETLELNSDDQGDDLDRLNIICIKEEDPEDDDYLCKTKEHIGLHSVTCPV